MVQPRRCCCRWGVRRAKEDSQSSDSDDTSYGVTSTEDDLPQFDSLFFPPGAFSGLAQSIGCGAVCGDGDVEEAGVRRADWWAPAELSAARGFEELSPASRLLEVRLIRHAVAEKEALVLQSQDLYEKMGAIDANLRYVAVWLNMNDASLMLMSEVTNPQLFERCIAGNFLKERLKLILNPVEVKLPFPAKGPKDADTVGVFFGDNATSSSCRTSIGAEVICVRVDLFSKWIMRMAMQKGGFRAGNTMELVLVDWAQRAVLAGCRLIVTEEFVKMMA